MCCFFSYCVNFSVFSVPTRVCFVSGIRMNCTRESTLMHETMDLCSHFVWIHDLLWFWAASFRVGTSCHCSEIIYIFFGQNWTRAYQIFHSDAGHSTLAFVFVTSAEHKMRFTLQKPFYAVDDGRQVTPKLRRDSHHAPVCIAQWNIQFITHGVQSKAIQSEPPRKLRFGYRISNEWMKTYIFWIFSMIRPVSSVSSSTPTKTSIHLHTFFAIENQFRCPALRDWTETALMLPATDAENLYRILVVFCWMATTMRSKTMQADKKKLVSSRFMRLVSGLAMHMHAHSKQWH